MPSEMEALSLMFSAGCGTKTKEFSIWPGTAAFIQLVQLMGSAHKPHTSCTELPIRWKSWLSSEWTLRTFIQTIATQNALGSRELREEL